MKKILTFAMVAGGALVLAACGGKTEEAPAAEPSAEPEIMAPAADATAAAEAPDAAETAAADLDPTNNPIGPAKTGSTAPTQ